jgi:hypothetical protein
MSVPLGLARIARETGQERVMHSSEATAPLRAERRNRISAVRSIWSCTIRGCGRAAEARRDAAAR